MYSIIDWYTCCISNSLLFCVAMHILMQKLKKKMCRGMYGLAVLNTTETIGIGMAVTRQDRTEIYDDYTSNPIPTSLFLTHACIYSL